MFRHKKLKQGLYKPRHPQKYRGDPTKIRYMSSWELNFHTFLDNNSNVLEWASEELAIPYIKPTDNRIHKYYPDYWVKYKDKSGNIKIDLIEVKPAEQTVPSVSKNNRIRLIENVTYAINIAKWKAAQEFARNNGWGFRIVSKNEIFK